MRNGLALHAAGISPARCAVALAITIAMSFGLSCDEALPPLQAPPTILSAQLTVLNAGKTIVVRDGVPVGTSGAIQINVTNVHDEVLQDSSSLRGRVEIWMKSNPEVRAVVLLTDADVVTGNLLNGRMLTINVGEMLVMLRRWPHQTVEGFNVWDYMELYPGTTMSGEPYCISKPITFVVRASLRVFKNYGQIQFPDQEVQLTYQVFDIACEPPT